MKVDLVDCSDCKWIEHNRYCIFSYDSDNNVDFTKKNILPTYRIPSWCPIAPDNIKYICRLWKDCEIVENASFPNASM
jgi:hypothetical protein